MTTKEFVKGINPHGIPYADMTKGKSVVVDILSTMCRKAFMIWHTKNSHLWLG